MTGDILREGAILTVDLDAVVSNWRLLSAASKPAECAAVVKADAYGLGAAEIALSLQAAGCQTFFVAHLDEGLELRKAIGFSSRIFVLNGTPRGTEYDFLKSVLIPVVNTVGELAAWQHCAGAAGRSMPIALQLDTGMTRLGLAPGDIAMLAADPALLKGLSVELIMSHLACADQSAHSANDRQRREFAKLRSVLPKKAGSSLANSAGVFIGRGFHFDLVRPGAALYGLNPTPGRPNPMKEVVGLSARVIQLRDVPTGTFVGYGHTKRTARPSKLATISLGYADGWPRSACTSAFFDDTAMPFIGRVSMDSIVVDATDSAGSLREGAFVDIVCSEQTVDDVASASGTIGYEILVRLGRRFRREYRSLAMLDERPGKSGEHELSLNQKVET